MIKGLSPALERILTAGNSAPSGENCQPWHFIVRQGTTVEVHLLPDRDQSAYSWGQRSSYLANGAAIENMTIAASKEGLMANVEYFPASRNKWHVANLAFESCQREPHPLAPWIKERVSNRKLYDVRPLSKAERNVLVAVGDERCAVVLVDDQVTLKRLARIGATNEEVMLGNRTLHNFFFTHVSWSKEEDNAKKVGFYIKTLELPPPAEKMFALLSYWPAMKILSKAGLNRVVAAQNASVNRTAAAMAGFLMTGTEPLDFVTAGRIIERFWLTATSLGLSCQPLTGMLFLALQISNDGMGPFTRREREMIAAQVQEASAIMDADDKHLGFIMRVGRAVPPTAKAGRFPLHEIVEIA